jgi:hypothetical protein
MYEYLFFEAGVPGGVILHMGCVRCIDIRGYCTYRVISHYHTVIPT